MKVAYKNITNFALSSFLKQVEFHAEGKHNNIYQYVDGQYDVRDLECVGPKSGIKRSHNNQIKREHTNISKFKDAVRKTARSNKLKFQPEGLFPSVPVGIDGSTQTFFTNLMQQFIDTFKSGTKLSLDLGISDAFKKTTEVLSQAGSKIVDFFKYVFAMVVLRVSPNSLFVTWILELIFGKTVEVMEAIPHAEFAPEGGSWINFPEFIASSLSMAVFSHSLKSIISENDYKGAIKSFVRFDGTKKISTIIGSLFKFITYIVENLAVRFNFKMPSMFSTGSAELDQIYARFLEMRSQVRDGFAPTYEFAEKVFFLQVELEGMVGKYPEDRAMRDRISHLLNSFRPLVDLCERSAVRHNGPRVEPLGVLIGGPSGAGKSTATYPSLLAFMAMVLPEEQVEAFLKNHNDFIFYRCNENDFWDGFRDNVHAVVYDDFGQQRDSVGSPSMDAFEIIRLINTAPFHLPFSAIEEKQRHFARVKTVFATTNRKKIQFDSIVNSGAVIRRFKISYVQVPRLEYCVDDQVTDLFNRVLDMDKVRSKHPLLQGQPETYVVTDVYEYFKWNYVTGHALSTTSISFQQLIGVMVATFRENAMKGDNLMEHHTYIKNKYIAMRDCGFKFAPEGSFERDASASFESDALNLRHVKESQSRVEDRLFVDRFYDATDEFPTEFEGDFYFENLSETLDRPFKRWEIEFWLNVYFPRSQWRFASPGLPDPFCFYRPPECLKKMGWQLQNHIYLYFCSTMAWRTDRPPVFFCEGGEEESELSEYTCDTSFSEGEESEKSKVIWSKVPKDEKVKSVKSVIAEAESTSIVHGRYVSEPERLSMMYYLEQLEISDDDLNSLQDDQYDLLKQEYDTAVAEAAAIKDEFNYVEDTIDKLVLGRLSKVKEKIFLDPLHKRFARTLKSVVNTLMNRFQEIGGLNFCLETVEAVGLYIVGFAVGWAAFVGTMNAAMAVYRWMYPEYNTESNHGKGGKKVIRTGVLKPRRERRAIGHNIVLKEPEGSAGQYAWLYSVLKKSVYVLKVGDLQLGYVTFLKGTLFFCPAHFEYMVLDYLQEHDGALCSLYKIGNPNAYVQFDWEDQVIQNGYVEDNGLDIMFMQINPQLMRPHQDISKFFVEPAAFTSGNRYGAAIPVLRDNHLTILLPEVHMSSSQSYTYRSFEEDIELKSRDLTYSAPTEKGDCGALVICNEGRFGRPVILGIHTAGAVSGYFGSKKLALGVSLSKSFIDMILRDFDMDCEMSIFEDTPVDSEFEVEGFTRLDEQPQPRMPGNTSIVRSQFYGKLWEVKQIPAKLRKFKRFNSDGTEVEIDPSLLAMRKYLHSEPPALPQVVYDCAYSHLCDKMMKNFAKRPWIPRVFSFEEALLGVPGVDYVDGIPRSTSPGYPHCLDNKQGGKRKWLGTHDDIDLSSEGVAELKKLVEDKHLALARGFRPSFIYVDYLKDELRPKEKVLMGKTRQFMAGPVELLILYKMYFGDFVRHVLANRIFNGMAIGIDPYTDWTTLAKYLGVDRGWKVTAGDYSGFDTRIPVAIGNVVKDIIHNFYGDKGSEAYKIREILFLEIINSRHISNGIVYEHNGGNPSGNFLTAIFNSMACYLIIAIAAVNGYVEDNDLLKSTDTFLLEKDTGEIICPIKKDYYRTQLPADLLVTGWKIFEESVRLTTFGDDNLACYDPKQMPSLGQSRISLLIKKYFDMEYTNETKTETVAEERELHEVSFLKRGFRYERGIWYAPLDLDVIKETLNWQKKNNDLLEFQLRIEGVLRELSLHGRQTYEEYSGKIVSLSRDILKYSPVGSTYEKAKIGGYGLALLN